MVTNCPKCGKVIPDDSVYCAYCGYGIKPQARSAQVSVGGALFIAAAVTSLVLFVFSLYALLNIYNWYPVLVAQIWFIYDQMLTAFSFVGFLFGIFAAALSLTRKSYKLTIVFAVACTFSGGGSWVISMIIPNADLTQSLFYYFLPLFVTAFIGTLLISFKKAEFNRD